MVDNLFCEAERLRERSQYREALSLYRKVLKGYRESGNEEGLLDCLLSLGDTSRMTGAFVNASDFYIRALSLGTQLRNRVVRADALVGLGLSKRALGEWQFALRLFSDAGEIYKKISDTRGSAFVRWAEGGAFRVGGDLRNSFRSFKEAKRLFASLGDDRDAQKGVAYCLCGLGGVSRVAGRFADSMTYYNSANKLLSSLRDRFGIAYSHCGIGNAFRMKGDFSEAIKHLRRAETIYKSIGDVVSYSYTLWSIGMTHLMNRRFRRAEASFQRASSQFIKTKDRRGTIYCRLGLGEMSYLKGDTGQAKKVLRSALKDSLKYRFAIETCHCRVLLCSVNSGVNDHGCYRAISSGLRFRGLPFNIP